MVTISLCDKVFVFKLKGNTASYNIHIILQNYSFTNAISEKQCEKTFKYLPLIDEPIFLCEKNLTG